LSKRRAGWPERRHAYDSDVNDETSSAPEGESTPPAAGLGRADVHMHTNLGDGWISPARLVQTATLRQLTLIAVTDHDHVEGARRVEELSQILSACIDIEHVDVWQANQ
jgi:hypothetical protein